MNDLLFLAHRIPYPPDKGEKIRAWHMLRALSATHRVHLGCFADDPRDLVHLETLRARCADVLCVPLRRGRARLGALASLPIGRPLSAACFDHPALRRWVAAKRAAGIDRAFVYCSAMAPYLMGGPGPRVLDMVDVDSAKWAEYARTAGFPARLVWRREARMLGRLERDACLAYDHTLLVSEPEAAHLRKTAGLAGETVSAMPNGVDLAYFSPALAHPCPYPPATRQIVFTGTMDYRPNGEAVVWFVRRVLPLLADPRVRFTIVGANPARAVRALAGPRVTVTGRVADPRPFLAHAAAVVAPLTIARGIQNKVLEAMAMGCAVVATPQAAEGIAAVPGRDLLVADTPESFAAALGGVLAGDHPGLPAAARQAMERHHDWARTLAALPGLFDPAPART